jgi:hypothetical protein
LPCFFLIFVQPPKIGFIWIILPNSYAKATCYLACDVKNVHMIMMKHLIGVTFRIIDLVMTKLKIFNATLMCCFILTFDWG